MKTSEPVIESKKKENPFFLFDKIILDGKEITGYIIPIGDVNLVFARTMRGLETIFWPFSSISETMNNE